MEQTITAIQQSTISNRNTTHSEDGKSLKGIEIDLFSHKIHEGNYQRVISQVVGEHFTVIRQPDVSEAYATFSIFPKDYALIEGGMMYTTAGRMVSDLINRGFLIQGFWTVK